MAAAYFTPPQEAQIVAAIQRAEALTTAEIRVHVHESVEMEVAAEAVRTFHRIGMAKTAERNGVLFFVAPYQRQFIVLGDEGIDQCVPVGFWETVKDRVLYHFRHQDMVKGLCEGIDIAGEQLRQHFPLTSSDAKDELPNTISYQ